MMNSYYHSNLVYGIANGLKEKWLQKLETGLPKADLVIVLDTSQSDSFSRKKSRRDKFEKDKKFSKKIWSTDVMGPLRGRAPERQQCLR